MLSEHAIHERGANLALVAAGRLVRRAGCADLCQAQKVLAALEARDTSARE